LAAFSSPQKHWKALIFRGALKALLKLGGFESLLHEKGARNHPLSEAAKKLNRVKSLTRTCLWMHDHVYGWKADKKDWNKRERGLVGSQEPNIQFLSLSPALFTENSNRLDPTRKP
jgi:hypothetical protein